MADAKEAAAGTRGAARQSQRRGEASCCTADTELLAARNPGKGQAAHRTTYTMPVRPLAAMQAAGTTSTPLAAIGPAAGKAAGPQAQECQHGQQPQRQPLHPQPRTPSRPLGASATGIAVAAADVARAAASPCAPAACAAVRDPPALAWLPSPLAETSLRVERFHPFAGAAAAAPRAMCPPSGLSRALRAPAAHRQLPVAGKGARQRAAARSKLVPAHE